VTERALPIYDPDALRNRYRAERDKRLRADGNEQYVDMSGSFAHYLDDPYVAATARAPLTDEVEVVVIGGGFGGLLAAARLVQAGFHDVRLIEKGGDVGGTWYWNRYPGAACDVESYIYFPLLEELQYVPTEKYASAPEILEHSRNIARHFGLYERACLSTEVTDLRWHDESGRWIVATNRRDSMRARYVVMANGPLHRPKLPGIPGVGTFGGHSFHTSRWDYHYTGGTSNGGLDGLADKVVGIIGTGATAVQCVPHLGRDARHLYVFQRTPSSIDVRNNRPTDPAWAQSLETGWQRRRMDNFNNLVSGIPESEDLVDDGWTDIIGNLLIRMRRGTSDTSAQGLADTIELADFDKMEQIRARVEQIVADPIMAEALKPWYRQFCKRPCFHDEYLQTFNRPNVTLVDTDGVGVDHINERGVFAAGQQYDLDCLIYATGFEVGTDYARRAGYEVYGRNGQTLTEKWSNGAATFHGLFSRGFPNLFIVSLVQSGFSVNFPHMLDEQSRHIAYVMTEARNRNAELIETSEAAEASWVQTIIDQAQYNVKFLEACTPGYYNNEGRPAERSVRNGSYGGGSPAFIKLLETWRQQGQLEGLELS
jgi:cyclohexanone monooxygenase